MENEGTNVRTSPGYGSGSVNGYYMGRPILHVPGSEYGGVGFEASELPAGVEPTHLLVGMGSYYIPVPVESARAMLIVTIMAILLLILLFLGWAFSEQRQLPTITVKPQLRLKRKARPFTRESKVGQAARVGFSTPLDGKAFQDQTSCEASGHSRWIEKVGRCRCIPPWWGADCSRESVAQDYVPSGVWDSGQGELVKLDESTLNHLSFGAEGEETCTSLCDMNEECKGVLWERLPPLPNETTSTSGRCTLLKEVVMNPGASLEYDPQKDSTLLLKDPDAALVFRDRVFIYGGRRAYRWWLEPQLNLPSGRSFKKQLMVVADHLYQLPFYPTGTRGGTTLTGLYGLQPWTLAQYNEILQQIECNPTDTSHSAKYYIHYLSQPLELPLSWYGLPLWVMYSHPTPSTTFGCS